jgi:hypothetical protein
MDPDASGAALGLRERAKVQRSPEEDFMPAKRSTRFRFIGSKRFRFIGGKIMSNRTAAIALIVVCIVGTAILITARGSESTSAAPAPVAQTADASSAAKPESAVIKRQKSSATTAAKPAGAQATAKASEQDAEPATIVGCLVQDHETFRLKNTAGEDAPKSRSWKSGFLKKSTKTIEVVDERHRLSLANHVGEQVSVTGMLDDRELQGTSLTRVAESCN